MGFRNVKGRRDSLDELIISLCRDQSRRDSVSEREGVSRRTRTELRFISYKIAEAAMEIVGDDYATYIHEIGESIGYAKSSLMDISESEYKLKKAEVKVNIAKRLHLID